MKCPFCNSKTVVFNSRSSHQSAQTWRRRRCLKCKHVFTTREKVDWSTLVKVTDRSGQSHSYSHGRLLLSILKASLGIPLPSEMATELVDSIELTLQRQAFATRQCTTDSIRDVAITVLHHYNPHLALQYAQQAYDNQPPLELVQKLSSEKI